MHQIGDDPSLRCSRRHGHQAVAAAGTDAADAVIVPDVTLGYGRRWVLLFVIGG
jgi:hypothetical protein